MIIVGQIYHEARRPEDAILPVYRTVTGFEYLIGFVVATQAEITALHAEHLATGRPWSDIPANNWRVERGCERYWVAAP